ncbi:MAG: nucleotide-binding protein, partial [Longimicrobiaceae bacterium]
MPARPRLFIGSSSEALDIARALQTQMDYDLECTIWTQGVFQPGQFTLEALVDAANGFDFAVLIAQSDDKSESRGSTFVTPRDNVLFELGMFMGILGRRRTFILYNRDAQPKLPSDLAGVTALTYATRADNNLMAALGPACYKLREEARIQGFREVGKTTAPPLARAVYDSPHTLSDETLGNTQLLRNHSVHWNVAFQRLAAVAEAVVEYQRGIRFSKLVYTYTILEDFSYRAEEVETLA